jgi:predicted transcriptional regulator
MMTDMQSGWAPAEVVRRTVTLPKELDRQVALIAKAQHSTPSSVMVRALGEVVEGEADLPEAQFEQSGSGERIERVLVLERGLNRAIEDLLQRRRTDISSLTAALAEQILAASPHGSNGAVGNGNGALTPATNS